MSGFLLDTNIPSEMLRPRPDASVAAWLKRQANETLFVSVVTMGELRRGITLLTERSSRRADDRGAMGCARWGEATRRPATEHCRRHDCRNVPLNTV